MLKVHHLGRSQSERIVLLCEELAIPYVLKRYDRNPQTGEAPAEYKALHPLGAAPVIQDGDVVLAESQAIVEYIVENYGQELSVRPGGKAYAEYLYWLNFPNGTLQPALMLVFLLRRTGLAEDSIFLQAMVSRTAKAMALVNSRLESASYLCGEKFTAADVMMVFCLTTMRYISPFDLSSYPAILAYLQRIGSRPAYKSAMAKGDPNMVPLLE